MNISKNLWLSILLFSALFLMISPASADDRNLLPKYGSLPKADWQIEADKAFLAATDQEYHGDRIKASMDTALRGWQYLQQGDKETAMYRFNQAWLLNPNNGVALWGMAAIEASTGSFEESIKLFAEAEKYMGSDLNFSIDYAKAIGKMAVQTKDDARLKDAFDRFEAIYGKAPQNVLNLQNWAITLAGVGHYAEAWQKVKLAEAAPGKRILDKDFVAALGKKMPRPKD